jgi:hypothetical protein
MLKEMLWSYSLHAARFGFLLFRHFFLGRIKISHYMGGVGMCFIGVLVLCWFYVQEGLALDEHYTRDEQREHRFRDSSLINRHCSIISGRD